MDAIRNFWTMHFSWLQLPTLSIRWTDILEIIILSFFIYHFLIWIRRTRTWVLLKGLLVLVFFISLAYIFEMDTIKFLITKGMDVAMVAAVIVFQPELRRALEQLGEQKLLSSIVSFDGLKDIQERFSDRTVEELIKGTMAMAKVKTGALIVIEKNTPLTEYERTGIQVDAIVTSQLLINIFEHNTPLHDGAVIVRGNRIVAATCYLPLSDNMELSKQLGTRHRAGVGISEVTDSVTIIVSEETGQVSVAQNGRLLRNISSSQLREVLEKAQNKKIVDNNKLRQLLKGRVKHEEKNRK